MAYNPVQILQMVKSGRRRLWEKDLSLHFNSVERLHMSRPAARNADAEEQPVAIWENWTMGHHQHHRDLSTWMTLSVLIIMDYQRLSRDITVSKTRSVGLVWAVGD